MCPRGSWWEIYGDTNLNALELQSISRPIWDSRARSRSAGAIARRPRASPDADLMPAVNFDPSYNRQRYSPLANPSFGDITANTVQHAARFEL